MSGTCTQRGGWVRDGVERMKRGPQYSYQPPHLGAPCSIPPSFSPRAELHLVRSRQRSLSHVGSSWQVGKNISSHQTNAIRISSTPCAFPTFFLTSTVLPGSTLCASDVFTSYGFQFKCIGLFTCSFLWQKHTSPLLSHSTVCLTHCSPYSTESYSFSKGSPICVPFQVWSPPAIWDPKHSSIPTVL